MDKVINLSLLKEPYNWLIVALMLAIAVYGLALLAPSMNSLTTGTLQAV